MQVDYALVQAFGDNFFESVQHLESMVRRRMQDGWVVAGPLLIREDVRYHQRDACNPNRYVEAKATFFMQPMVLTEEAQRAAEVRNADSRRAHLIDMFPKLLVAQRILEERAAGKSWEEIGEERKRAASTVKGWTWPARYYGAQVAADAELNALYLAFKEKQA